MKTATKKTAKVGKTDVLVNLVNTMDYLDEANMRSLELFIETFDEGGDFSKDIFEKAIKVRDEGNATDVYDFLEENDTITNANYLEQDDFEMYYYMETEDTNTLLFSLVENYEKRYKTSVRFIALLAKRASHYGAIGGNGATGYSLKETETPFEDWFHNADELELSIKGDRTIQGARYDHDGTDYFTLAFITENMIEKQGGSAFQEGYTYEEDVAEELINKGKVKPVKVPKALLNEFYGL